MGFTAGIYRFPKYNDDISVTDLHYISNYIYYDHSSWAKENYKTAHDYAISVLNLSSEDLKKYNPPPERIINFYKANTHEDEFHKISITHEMGTWCSNGGGAIYEWFNTLKKQEGQKFEGDYDGLSVKLTSQDVAAFATFCWEYIDHYNPQPCSIDNVFRYIKSKEPDAEEDDYDIHLIHCDGIECAFDDGSIKRFDTNADDYPFYVPKEVYDDWEMSGYKIGLEIALDILRTVDFDLEEVIYEGGW